MYSMVIGRFQPFHDGHAALIQHLLDEGKDVCVAIRDTKVGEDNPYTAVERVSMIAERFPLVSIIVIPDVEEVVHGRKPGWSVREVRLDEEVEAISGTRIRNGEV